MLRIVFTAVLLALHLPGLVPAAGTARELLRQAEAKIQAQQFVAAESALAEARKLDPSDVEVLYRLGYVRYRQRKLSAARDDFAEVVKLAPPAWYSRYFLGRISLLENKPREALTWLEPILTARQSVFDTPSQLAAAYEASGMPNEAITALRTAIAAAPWDASLYYRLGRLYAGTGKRELAAEAYENSRRLRNASREDVEALMHISEALTSGDVPAVRKSAAPIADRPDADPNALVALGVLYGGANLSAEALDVFNRAVARDPAFFQAQYNRGLALLKLNRPAEALTSLSSAVQLLPQSVEANRTYGLAAVMTQRYADAVVPLERAFSADSGDVRTGALLATAYLRTGSDRKAASLLAGAAFRNASDPAPLLLRVEALNAAEDPAGALDAALEAQKRFAKYPQTHMAVAGQLTRLGRYQDARPAFEETLKLAPGYPEAELGLGDSLARSGDHASAIAHYRAAATVERTAVSARLGLARSLTALRRFEEARTILEESVASYPAESALHVELSRVYARLGMPELAAEHTRIVEKLREAGTRQ